MEDAWGYYNPEFAVDDSSKEKLKKCKKLCPPPPKCYCEEDRFNAICKEPTEDGEYEVICGGDTGVECDCVCMQTSSCYPDECDELSLRSYHEEHGVRIKNNDFEIALKILDKIVIINWDIVGGEALIDWFGFSGHALYLDGTSSTATVMQSMRPVDISTVPFKELCVMYGILEVKKERCSSEDEPLLQIKITDENGVTHSCNLLTCKGTKCEIYNEHLGWEKKCCNLSKVNKISKIEIVANNVRAVIDNINLGNYFDFVTFYTKERRSIENRFGYGPEDAKSEGCIKMDKLEKYEEELETGGNKTTYTLEFSTLPELVTRDDRTILDQSCITPQDFVDGAELTIYTHFRNITFKLFPPTHEAANPKIDVKLRRPTKIESILDVDPAPLNPGDRVNVRLRLYYSDTGDPIQNERVYISAVGDGKIEFSGLSVDDEGRYYVTTDANGEATFSYVIYSSFTITEYYPGSTEASPSFDEIHTSTKEKRSPLSKGEFLANLLILILILIFILLSYRFFLRQRSKLEEWLQDLIGKE